MRDRPVLIGVPCDAGSTYLRGAAAAPPLIREALFSPAGNPWSERLRRAGAPDAIEDRGDLVLQPGPEARTTIEAAIRTLADAGRRFVALGGDHAITYPVLRGLAGSSSSLTVLQIDAHPDLYDTFDDDRFTHASPFARVMEEGLVARLVQVGIRASTPHQRDQAERFGVEQIDMRAWEAGVRPALSGDVYLSIDLDGLDPSVAPGVSHREPGGLGVRDVLALLDLPAVRLIGADVVEFNPARDDSGLTASVAAKLVKELLAAWQEDA